MFKKLMSVVVVTLLAVCAFCLTGCGEKKSTELVIGGMGPLTGPAAVYGQAVYNSASMAVEEINANGGYKGIKFEVTALGLHN